MRISSSYGEITISYRYPVTVNGRYITDPSPIPRWDVPKLHMADTLFLFGAGREKRIYAIPPHTPVEPLEFEDHPFRTENFTGKTCARCGATDTFLDEVIDNAGGGAELFLLRFRLLRQEERAMEPLIRIRGLDKTVWPGLRPLRWMQPGRSMTPISAPTAARCMACNDVSFDLYPRRGPGRGRRERLGQEHPGAPAPF